MQEAHKVLDFISEENRRKTFKKWVFSDSDPCNADKMAEAGFIFIGSKSEPDAVKCFVCNKSLDGWEATDDPWKEHLKHNKKCFFAKLQKPPDNWTLKQLFDLVDIITQEMIKSYCDKRCDDFEAKLDKYVEKFHV